jgi:hypothetical protein
MNWIGSHTKVHPESIGHICLGLFSENYYLDCLKVWIFLNLIFQPVSIFLVLAHALLK